MSDNPIKLWPGPCVDGRETYFAKGRDIEPGWERRLGEADPWRQPGVTAPSDHIWYQVRPPAKLPDPLTVSETGDASSESLVVEWGEMKDRTDLDQWERLTDEGSWRPVSWVKDHGVGYPHDYPIRIRRKETST